MIFIQQQEPQKSGIGREPPCGPGVDPATMPVPTGLCDFFLKYNKTYFLRRRVITVIFLGKKCKVNLQAVIQAEALARGAALPLGLRISFSTLSTSQQCNILQHKQNHAEKVSKMLFYISDGNFKRGFLHKLLMQLIDKNLPTKSALKKTIILQPLDPQISKIQCIKWILF